MITIIGFTFYMINYTVGILARLRLFHIPILHRICFACTCIATIAAAILEFHFGLIITLAVLIVLPRTKPWKMWHPIFATVGLIGYLLTFIF